VADSHSFTGLAVSEPPQRPHNHRFTEVEVLSTASDTVPRQGARKPPDVGWVRVAR